MPEYIILDRGGYRTRKPRYYGFSNFVGDFTLTCCTFGLWGIWWIIRELSR